MFFSLLFPQKNFLFCKYADVNLPNFWDIKRNINDSKLDLILYFKEWDERKEKQKLLIERIFVLIRYVFGIGTESGRNIQVKYILLNFFKTIFRLKK